MKDGESIDGSSIGDGKEGGNEGGFSDSGDDELGSDELEELSLVSARGTSEGLIVRIVSRGDGLSIQAALRDFLISRSEFLKGAGVFVEWVGGEPHRELERQVERIMRDEFSVQPKEFRIFSPDISVSQRSSSQHSHSQRSHSEGYISQAGSRLSSTGSTRLSDSVTKIRGGRRVSGGEEVFSLFDGIATDEGEFEEEFMVDEFGSGDLSERAHRSQSSFGASRHSSFGEPSPIDMEEMIGDVPDCRVIATTLRSGQRIESEHSLLIFGDVNSGAEVIAGGDIIVLGKLRGVAHAGAFDETGGGRVILALDLAPTQLRIGAVITRGATESGRNSATSAAIALQGVSATSARPGAQRSGAQRSDHSAVIPEIARVEGDTIVVEPYSGRGKLLR